MVLGVDNKAALDFHKSVNNIYMDICEPLKDLGIKNHCYFKGKPSGEYLMHCSNSSIPHAYFLNVKVLGAFFTEKIETCSKIGSVSFVGGDVTRFEKSKDPMLHFICEENCWNFLLVARNTCEDYMETFSFALGKEAQNPIGHLMERMDLLERFICYFDDVGKEITQVDNVQCYARFEQTFNLQQTSAEVKFAREAAEFLRKTTLKKLTIWIKNEEIEITKREGQCLYFLMQNYTNKEIARMLDISPRTIEKFINIVRRKLGKYSRSELVYLIKEHKLEKSLELLV